MRLDLEQPWFLVALLALPLVFLVLRVTLVDSPRSQLVLSALTRCAVLALLGLALASLLHLRRSDRLAVWVLGDLSDSVPETAAAQLSNLWTEARDVAPEHARLGLAWFARTNRVIHPLEAAAEPDPVWARPADGSETAMERALLRAWQGLPGDRLGRLWLLTDGNETSGDALALARRAAAHEVKVFTRPYTNDTRSEVLLEDLLVPSEVRKGQSFAVKAVAHSTEPTRAKFTLFRDGFKIQEKELELKPGANTLAFQETKAKEGLLKYELRVQATNDFYADNNVAAGLVSIAGEPRVLLLEGSEREARFLARALEAENIRVDARDGKGLPGSLEELAAFDAVILSDVPATDLNVRQMSLLRSYIEDLGGGFIMVGGQNSFGLGGYYRTAIEDALPVRMKSEKKKDTPGLAMMLVIDKSGSMEGDKVQLAKEAAIAAVELLSDRDYVGVIAFDGDTYVITELQSAANKLGIVSAIERIEAGGGTSMHPPMVRAHEMLQGVTAALKHCIVLTDGVSQPGDFPGITQQMSGEQITVSTVAVGEDIDAELLQSIARWGRGRFYHTTDPHDVPQIFTKETMTASKSSLIKEPFLAQVLRDDPVVRGVDWKNAPFLFGYTVTTPKPTAQVALLTERGDPLLVSWRFGLGKSAAFMSDAKNTWAADWLRWPGYAQFWAQLVRDVMRTSQQRGAETSIALKPGRAEVLVDSTDEAGNFLNGLKTTAQLVKPDLTLTSLVFRQSAPGRYEAGFPMPEMGSYLLRIRQSRTGADGQDETVSDFTRAVTMSYQPEYRHLGLNEPLLRSLAESTGGRHQATAADVFTVGPEERALARDRLWPWLLSAALILFVLDVALRRLDLAGHRLFRETPRRYG